MENGLEGRKRGLEKSIKKLLKMFRQKGLDENIDTGARDKCLDKCLNHLDGERQIGETLTYLVKAIGNNPRKVNTSVAK